MSAFSPILPMLREFYQRADWSQEAAAFVKVENIDLEQLNAHAGIVAAPSLTFHSNGLFDFDGTTPAIVIEVYAEDDETTIDLCAWPISEPDRFATVIGAASVLGSAQIANPASWAFGGFLEIHRTPLHWLKAGCHGVCILDYSFASYELGQSLGPLLAVDERRAAELRKFLCKAPIDPKSIIYPRNTSKRAA